MNLTDLMTGIYAISLSVLITVSSVQVSYSSELSIRTHSEEFSRKYLETSERISSCMICEAEEDILQQN